MRKAFLLAAAVAALAICASGRAAEFQEKWVYADVNFNVDKDVDDFIDLMKRAKALGCTAMQVKDPQFGFMGLCPPSYHANIGRAVKAAAEIGIPIIPAVYPFGYSGGYIVQDPNLAAGIPVRDAPFVVKNGRASPDPASAPLVLNPGFDEAEGDTLAGWKQDFAGVHCFVDREIKHSGAASLKIADLDKLPEEARGSCRASQVTPVKPFRYYRLSVWTKADDVIAEREDFLVITSSDGKRRLCYTILGVARNEDWTRHEITFNTLEATSIDVSVGVSDAEQGTIWFDDVELEPAGLSNVLRSDTKPFKVTSADGSVTYVEGKDFEPVADPNLAKDALELVYYLPFPSFIYHKGPDVELTKDSRIKDGDTILLSYFHTHRIYADQILVSMEDPKVFELMDDQVKRVVEAFNPPGIFMNYDEIRICGWEEQPGGTHYTPGQLLAQNITRGIEIIRKYAPEAKICTWSDMFNPNHNAGKIDGPGYYLCNGDWSGSWEGLPTDVVIMAWGGGMQWFAERGHKQMIAGYYDSDPRRGVDRWLTRTQNVPNIIGIMYTTWQGNYSDLDEFFKAVDEWSGPVFPMEPRRRRPAPQP